MSSLVGFSVRAVIRGRKHVCSDTFGKVDASLLLVQLSILRHASAGITVNRRPQAVSLAGLKLVTACVHFTSTSLWTLVLKQNGNKIVHVIRIITRIVKMPFLATFSLLTRQDSNWKRILVRQVGPTEVSLIKAYQGAFHILCLVHVLSQNQNYNQKLGRFWMVNEWQ